VSDAPGDARLPAPGSRPGAPAAPAAPAVGRGGAAGRRSHAPRAKPVKAAQLPYLLVLAIAVGGLAYMWQGGIGRAKEGTLALAGAMSIGAFARLVLPEARAGMLASRRRLIDVVSLAALGIGLLVAGLVLPT
jgi:Protein of unknown function (DUF3017)